MSSVRRRKNVTNVSKGRAVSHTTSENESGHKSSSKESDSYPFALVVAGSVAGVAAMIYCGYWHSWYMYTLHENNMWFTNIKVCNRKQRTWTFDVILGLLDV